MRDSTALQYGVNGAYTQGTGELITSHVLYAMIRSIPRVITANR